MDDHDLYNSVKEHIERVSSDEYSEWELQLPSLQEDNPGLFEGDTDLRYRNRGQKKMFIYLIQSEGEYNAKATNSLISTNSDLIVVSWKRVSKYSPLSILYPPLPGSTI